MTPPASQLVRVCLLLLVIAARGEDLPGKGGPDDLATDASKLLNDLPALTDPADDATDGPAETIQQAKARLERAQKKMVRWEKLLKDGVLSKSEVERCTVEVAEALVRYERVNVAEIQRRLVQIRTRVSTGAPDQALIESEELSLRSAQAAASKAAAQLLQTKFDLAKINLERQRKLYELKLISRAGVQEAQALVQRFADQKSLQDMAEAEPHGDKDQEPKRKK